MSIGATNGELDAAQMLPRPGLVDRILNAAEPVVLIEAPAGMGKTVLVRQVGARLGLVPQIGAQPPAVGTAALWDIPPRCTPDALPEGFLDDSERLIIAKRPEVALPGLDRAVAYGRVLVLDTEALMITSEELLARLPRAAAQRALRISGGWPLLLPFAAGTGSVARLEEILAQEWMAMLPAEAFVTLGRLVNGEAVTVAAPGALAPAVRAGAPGSLRSEALRETLAAAHLTEGARRLASGEAGIALAAALREQGHTADAIMALQRAGRMEAALAILEEEHGFEFFYRCGDATFARMLAGFPADFAQDREVLILCHCLQALKCGDLARTRQMVAEYFGVAALQPEIAVDAATPYSRPFRFFRVLMLIYEDLPVSEALFERMFSMLSELPIDAHLIRGSFYNSMLELLIRQRRFVEAEEMAIRAAEHYTAARVPMLLFYIRLHQSIMRLMQGDVQQAQRFAAAAASELAACGFDSSNDTRLLALLQACIDYEGGRAEPLARFLRTEFDEFSHSEVWPAVIELALHYGSQALSEHFSTLAARSYLDRWRVYQIHTHHFRAMIDMREAIILQNGNRWQEAAVRLRSVTGVWPEGERPESINLRQTNSRDGLMLALVWLRQEVFEAPNRPGLVERLEQAEANLRLQGRQKIGVRIWLAYACKHRRDLTRCRSILLSTLEQAARMGSVAPLAEERYFLADLLSNRRLRDFLQSSVPAQGILRRLGLSGLAARPPGAKVGLTRRETKVLLMIAEGSSNKYIANALGLSEATVKYHLGNTYRKLGCKGRREAVGAAQALGLLA